MILVAIRHSDTCLFGKLITAVRGGDQSHTECGIPDVVGPLTWCVSASWQDHGVRSKMIDLTDVDKWRVYRWTLPHDDLAQWLEAHKGWGYDWLGVLGFLWRPLGHFLRLVFCSEASASILGFEEPHLYDPRTLESVVERLGTRVIFKAGAWTDSF